MKKRPLQWDLRRAQDVQEAFNRAGWTDEEIDKLLSGTGTMSEDVLLLLRGHDRSQSRLIYVDPTIVDCDADPYMEFGRNGEKVIHHQRSGPWKWDAARIELVEMVVEPRLYRRPDLATSLEAYDSRRFLNANVLDFLLEFPEYIPKDWTGKQVMFPGTRYHHEGEYARLMRQGRQPGENADEWYSSACWLDDPLTYALRRPLLFIAMMKE